MNKNIYRQVDSRWGNLTYPAKPYYLKGSGSGCCACTHVIIEQEKYKNYTPKNVRPYMVEHGFATKGHGTTWAGIKLTLEHYGNSAIQHTSMKTMIATLDDRKAKKLPTRGVLLFKAGKKGGITWTTGGHYVAFVNYKVSNGKHYFYTKDSGGRKNDGWHCFETQMDGLVKKCWSAVPKKLVEDTTVKTQGYTGKFPSPILTKGNKGTQVKYLQKFLNWYRNSYNLKVDGKFGDATEKAVKDFQKREELTIDGIVGIKTCNKMQAIKKKVTTTPTSTSTKPKEDSTPVVKKPTKVSGIDISAWQGNVSKENFLKAKADGVKFIILRIGFTGSKTLTPTLDNVFENNYKNAIAAGLPVGVYFYSLATSVAEAKKEADFVVKQLKGKKMTYPVYIDIEDPTRQAKCSKAVLAAVAKTFCDTVKAAGYTPGIYASVSWLNSRIGAVSTPHSTWVAQYYTKCEYTGKYDMWQYTSSGKVNGLSGNIDMNYWYNK